MVENIDLKKATINKNGDENDICDRETSGFYEGGAF
jgi:hypothetical protein